MVRELLTHGLFLFSLFSFHGSIYSFPFSMESFLPFPILLYFWNFSNPSFKSTFFFFPIYLPHTICTIRAFALNVRTSGVSATSADPRRLEPLIHQMTSIPIERGSSEPQSSLLFLFYSHIGAIANGPLFPLYPSAIGLEFRCIVTIFDRS